jgi:pyruvate kinase
MLAALRPNALIFAATNRVEVARRLMLYRGVVPIVTTIAENVDATGTLIARHLLASGLVKPGEEVVFVSIHSDPAQPAANFLKLHQL